MPLNTQQTNVMATFCDEKLRKAADRLIASYNLGKALQDHYTASEKQIVDDAGIAGTEVMDAHRDDVANQITKTDIQMLMAVVDKMVTDSETPDPALGGLAPKDLFLKFAMNPENYMR